MPTQRNDAQIDPQALEEAAEWLMRLGEGDFSASQRAELERWSASSPERHRAWARAQVLQGKLGTLPRSLAMSALDRPSNPSRRIALAKLATILALLPVGWGSWKLLEAQPWTADYRTSVGQRRELTLDDGSRITLNTDTAIDVLFDAQQRLIRLREGEILVQTAPDNLPQPRPFLVSTRQGRIQALGTRFTVREWQPHTRLAVLDGAVRIELPPESGVAPRIVNAGQRTDFSSHAFGQQVAADDSVSAWTQGMLMADNMRLADFVAELARYRKGFVRCDPAVADLRISGAFPISDSQRTLKMLVQTYPLIATGHLSGYWITLSPA
ncbi:FecR domain-containing protein [Pseudomonas sp. FEN]|uniref:FecR domain-containing protein n=1 Tax=Pseudomonas sp. FEN TaxID=2767468 RepID=UPI00174D1C8A|nr:FecR domain-containing protein [Pseudomonas sp. FEN]CAD5200977.1 Fe2+-dicitrate sensor, membrane component [Pseudomonas sp. FEN]